MKNEIEEEILKFEKAHDNPQPMAAGQQAKPKQKWHKRKRALYYASGALAVFLLAWLIWHKQMADMWASLFDRKPVATTAKLATLDNKSGQSSGGNSSTGSTGSTSGKSATNSSSETLKTMSTTTTTTTTTTNPPDNGDGGSSTGLNPLLSLSTNVKPGLTRQQVINLANGVGPSSCTDISLTSLIQTSVCTWTADGKSVVVSLQNGIVTGLPVKIGF